MEDNLERIKSLYLEILAIKEKMKSGEAMESPEQLAALEQQLEACTLQMEEYIAKAAEAGEFTSLAGAADLKENIQQMDELSQQMDMQAGLVSLLGEKLQSLKDAYELSVQAAEAQEQLTAKINETQTALEGKEAKLLAVQEILKQMEAEQQNFGPVTNPEDLQAMAELSAQIDNVKESIQEVMAEIEQESTLLTGLEEQYTSVAQVASNRLGLIQEIKKTEEALKKEKEALEESQKWYSKMEKGQTGLTKEYAVLSKGTVGSIGAMGRFAKTLQGLPGPLANVGKSIEGVTKLNWKFIATPIGAILTAISLALQAVSHWFNNTAEGQKALIVVTAAFEQGLQFLNDMLSATVGWIGKLFSKSATKDAEEMTDAIEGQAEANKKNLSLWEKQKQQFQERKRLKELEKKLEKDAIDYIKEKADLEDKMHAAKSKVNDKSLPEKERLEALQELRKATEEMHAKELAMAQEKLEMIEAANKLAKEGQEDMEAQHEAYAALLSLQRQQQSEVQDLDTQEKSIKNESAEEKKKLQEQHLNTVNQLNELIKKSRKDLEDAELAIMKEGTEKQKKESERRYTQQIEQINKEKEAMEELYRKTGKKMPAGEIENFSKRADIAGKEKEQRDQSIDAKWKEEYAAFEQELTGIQQSEEEKRLQKIKEGYDKKRAWAEQQFTNGNLTKDQLNDLDGKIKEAEKQEELNGLLQKYQDFYTKRSLLDEGYQNELKTIQDRRTAENGAEIDKAIEELTKRRIEALAQMDQSMKVPEATLSQLFEDMSNRSAKSIRKVSDQAQALFKDLSNKELQWTPQIEDTHKISRESFEALQMNPEELAKLGKKVEEVTKAADAAENAFIRVGASFKKMLSSGADSEDFMKNFGEFSKATGDVTAVGGKVSGMFRELGDAFESETMKGIADGIDQAMEVVNTTMDMAKTGAQLGGPIGAAVGAVVGLGVSLTTMFAKNRAHRKQLQEQIEKNNRDNLLAEIDVNRQWRERYEWAKKIGESSLSHIKRQGEELEKQSTENAKVQEELMSKLLGTDYMSNEYFKKTGLFGKGKGKIVQEFSSLMGKSWEEIELLAAQEKLSEEGKKYYEALKAAREEGEDLAKRQEEYLEMVRETFTGSGYDSVVSSIVEGFKAGKRSAADFADTFHDLMQNAVVSALQLATDEKVRKWYEDFASMAKDGLTEKDIEKLNKEWDKIINQLGSTATQLEAVTGISIGGNSSPEQTGTSKGFETMTQDQASELNGRFTALQMAGEEIRGFSARQTEEMTKANLYLGEIYGLTSSAHSIVDELRTIQVNSYVELTQINTNTNKSAKSLRNIESDMSEVKQKIANL